jgi:hypothetical protein
MTDRQTAIDGRINALFEEAAQDGTEIQLRSYDALPAVLAALTDEHPAIFMHDDGNFAVAVDSGDYRINLTLVAKGSFGVHVEGTVLRRPSAPASGRDTP